MFQKLSAFVLFGFALNLQSATIATSIDVSCRVEALQQTTNPCSLTGAIPDPMSGELPYAEASASASARYGTLTAETQYRADHGGQADVEIIAEFTDQLTILSTGAGRLELDVLVPGCIACTTGVTTDLHVASSSQQLVSPGPGDPQTWSFPITLGDSFLLSARLRAAGSASDNDDNGPPFPMIFQINAIRVLDASGDQLRNFHYETEFLRAYPVEFGQLVPEPNLTGLVTVSGIFMVAIARHRRR
jgi:hypothetical protein